MKLTIEVGERLAGILESWLRHREPKLSLIGGSLVKIVRATHPDIQVRIVLPTGIGDAEGNVVRRLDPSTLSAEIQSDNPEAVSVTQDTADPLLVSVHFGASGEEGEAALANVNCLIREAGNDSLVGSFGEQFTVIPGEGIAPIGGKLDFSNSGLVEETAPGGNAGGGTTVPQ
jgi:hypothetical protein